MRIFLIQSVQGLWPTAGEWISNVRFLKYLSSKGHATAQLCYGTQEEIARRSAESEKSPNDITFETDILELHQKGQPPAQLPFTKFFTSDGIFMIVLDRDRFREHFPSVAFTGELKEADKKKKLTKTLEDFMSFLIDQIIQFKATHVLFSDAMSLRATSMRLGIEDVALIYVVHCAEQLPFGPYKGVVPNVSRNPAELSLLHKLDGIWSVSKALHNYANEYGQLKTTPLPHHIWTYVHDMHNIPPQARNWNNEYIGMINPSSFKGVSIFLKLAKTLPQRKYVVWQSWAPEEEAMRQIDQTDNIEKRPSTANTDEIWNTIKILLVPSLWFEAWGMVVTEAQLRGIPVVSSSVGGIPEAKLEVPFIIPTTPLTECDTEQKYEVSDQDIEPWVEAVNRLMTNQDEYERIADFARKKTIDWLSEVGENVQESWLRSIQKNNS